MTYVVYFANAGVAETGLTLTWEFFLKVSDGADPGDSPAFTEVGGGWYKFTYDPIQDISAVVDGSVTLGDTDRYVPVYLSQQDSRLDTRLSRIANDETGHAALRVDIKNRYDGGREQRLWERISHDETGLSALKIEVKNRVEPDVQAFEKRFWDRINHDDTGLQSIRVEVKNRNTTVSSVVDFEKRFWDRINHDDTGLSSMRIEVKNIEGKMVRALGLMQENFRMSSMTFDKNGNLLTGTIKIYDTAADANNEVNELATYTVTATYTGAKNLTSYIVTKN